MSIPTSLIVVILVAAWLAVLVPMVARRREQVPETDTAGGTFRVLRRASASIRRRPILGRRDDEEDMEEDDIADEIDGEEPVHREALDEELLDEDEDDEFADAEYARADVEDGDHVETEYVQTEYVETEYVETEYVRAEFEETEVTVEREPVRVGGARSFTEVNDTFQETSAVRGSSGEDRHSGPSVHRSRRDPLEGLDEARLRPVPRRHGRGGFDPDAAEIARAYRYSRRRRITVILLLATIAFSAAAYLVKPVLWSGTAFFALLLVGYLGYLRRQVRIENDIRERRLARLRRARQIRPEYHLDQPEAPFADSSPVGSAVPVSVPPTGYRRGREVVDLEDDDPSFDDLDYYEPVAYRRASGQ